MPPPPSPPAAAHVVTLRPDGGVAVGGHTLLAPPRGAKPALTAAPAPGLPGALVLGVATPDGAERACWDTVLGELSVER